MNSSWRKLNKASDPNSQDPTTSLDRTRIVGKIDSIVYSAIYLSSLTLNVVIKCQVFILVFLQQSEGVVVSKVLKLNQCVLSIPTTSEAIHVCTIIDICMYLIHVCTIIDTYVYTFIIL